VLRVEEENDRSENKNHSSIIKPMKTKILFLLKLSAGISIGMALYRFLKYHNGLHFIDEHFSYILAVLLILFSFIILIKFITKMIKLTVFILIFLILAGVGTSLYFGNKEAIKRASSRISV
jgi:glucan phosphoethanolaminetransferase (alkaline phosphatase superfamily)